MRSKWKFNNFTKQASLERESISNRNLKLTRSFGGKKVSIFNGKKYATFNISSVFLSKFLTGEFSYTKKRFLPPQKGRKKKGRR